MMFFTQVCKKKVISRDNDEKLPEVIHAPPRVFSLISTPKVEWM